VDNFAESVDDVLKRPLGLYRLLIPVGIMAAVFSLWETAFKYLSSFTGIDGIAISACFRLWINCDTPWERSDRPFSLLSSAGDSSFWSLSPCRV
jgi:hypothetical protein